MDRRIHKIVKNR